MDLDFGFYDLSDCDRDVIELVDDAVVVAVVVIVIDGGGVDVVAAATVEVGIGEVVGVDG